MKIEDLKDWLNNKIKELDKESFDMFASSRIIAHMHTLEYIKKLETDNNNQSLKDAGYF